MGKTRGENPRQCSWQSSGRAHQPAYEPSALVWTLFPNLTVEPPVVVFVDGVRRVEARVWVTGDDGDSHPGICASYAAGAVCCDERATVLATEVERGLFCRSSGAASITTRSGTYGLRATAADDPDTLAIALQGAMAELEARVSAAAVMPGQLLVLDGPLGARSSTGR